MGFLRIATILTILAGSFMSAQEETTFRVDVRLVRMIVSVKNAMGDPVGQFAKGNFRVFDNDVPQELSVFERESTQPLSVSILFDTSLSTISDVTYKKDGVRRFVKTLFAEGNQADAAAIYAFNDQVTLQSGFTRNIDRLHTAVNGLRPSGGTALYDALYLASRDLEKRPGRHIVIGITDGGDTASRYDFQKALEALHRANAVFYSLVVIPIAADAGRNLKGENALITLTTWTGGKVFFPTAGEALNRTFEELVRDLRTQYVLGYYPKNVPVTKERFHRVRVLVDQPSVTVSARNGYFVDTPAGESGTPTRGPGLRPELR